MILIGNNQDMILSEIAQDQSGQSVALNGEGSCVAIGAQEYSDDGGAESGHVRVYNKRDTGTVTGQTSSIGQDL